MYTSVQLKQSTTSENVYGISEANRVNIINMNKSEVQFASPSSNYCTMPSKEEKLKSRYRSGKLTIKVLKNPETRWKNCNNSAMSSNFKS